MRILFIDDDAMIRETAREMLESTGHEVIEAENGRRGLDKYRKQQVDVVITDIIMPEKDGLETILEIRGVDPNVRIIAISGACQTRHLDFLDIAKKFGATATLAKPFRKDDLIACVNGFVATGPPGPRRSD